MFEFVIRLNLRTSHKICSLSSISKNSFLRVTYLYSFFTLLCPVIFTFFLSNFSRINELLGDMHALRHISLHDKNVSTRQTANKNDGQGGGMLTLGSAKNVPFADLSRRLLSENIPLHASSAAVLDYIISHLTREENRAVELNRGLYQITFCCTYKNTLLSHSYSIHCSTISLKLILHYFVVFY